jgi:ABC-type amino acid transport system permease subunit
VVVIPAINVEWSIIAERIFSPPPEFWRALLTTVSIAVIAQLLGVGLGLVSALAGLSRFWPMRALSAAYVLLIRPRRVDAFGGGPGRNHRSRCQ